MAPPRLMAALQVCELARLARVTPAHPALQRASAAIDRVSRDDQVQILTWMLHRRGVSVEATSLVEGVLAMRAEHDESTSQDAAASAGAPGETHTLGENSNGAVASVQSAAAGAPAPINPGSWSPPGDQPIPLYIGNEAHAAIGEAYRDAHPADRVLLNHSPLSSILEVFEAMSQRTRPDVLTDEERLRRPDLTNVSRRHLYEIKPVAAQAAGAAQARMYLSSFEKAGVAMSLGPTGEPGTSGGLPAPGGVFLFEAPEPGVITYQYRKGRLVPVPVPLGRRQPADERRSRWHWELQPLTQPQKQAIVTTTVGGAVLLIIMIILAPVGA
jgi:hypothetical protein